MNPPPLPEYASPQQMRKALVRMRLELHRQELHYETLRLAQPLQQLRAWPQRLNLPHAPLWGLVGVTLLGVIADTWGVPMAIKTIFSFPLIALAAASMAKYPLKKENHGDGTHA